METNVEFMRCKTHVIIDTNHLLYRAKQITREFTYRGVEGYHHLYSGDSVTILLGMLSSIETLLKTQIEVNEDVTVTFTFDHRNNGRSLLYPGYKGGRPELSGGEKASLNSLQGILRDMGFNVLSVVDFEADDLVASLVRQYENSFDQTLIYTNDADLLTNLSDKVYVMRYKSTTSNYSLITKDNFEKVMSEEYDCIMPYNVLLLYKSLVGDSSDKIKGVPGFGGKSFNKLISALNKDGDYNFEMLLDPINVKDVINKHAELICKSDSEKLAQGLLCLEVVIPVIGTFEINTDRMGDAQRRRDVYQRLGFTRLCNRIKD